MGSARVTGTWFRERSRGRSEFEKPSAGASGLEPCEMHRWTHAPRATRADRTSCRLVTGIRRKRRTSRNNGSFVQVRVYLLHSTCQPREACIGWPKPMSSNRSLDSRAVDRAVVPVVHSVGPGLRFGPRPARRIARAFGARSDLDECCVDTRKCDLGPANDGVIRVQAARKQTAARARGRWLDVAFRLRQFLRRPRLAEGLFRETAPRSAGTRTTQSSAAATRRTRTDSGCPPTPQFDSERSRISTPGGGTNSKFPAAGGGSTTMFWNRIRVRFPNRSTIDVSLIRPVSGDAVMLSRS